MTEPQTNPKIAFALAAEIENEPLDAVVYHDSAGIGSLEQALRSSDSWSAGHLAGEIDGLLTIDPDSSQSVRLRASARTAMIEGAARAMDGWANTAQQPDAIELLMRELAAVPDLDDLTVPQDSADGIGENAGVEPRRRRRSMADELADEIEAILSSNRDPANYDDSILSELIWGAEIDAEMALAGIRAASQQDDERRQVIYQGADAAATCSIVWSEFLTRLAKRLNLAS